MSYPNPSTALASVVTDELVRSGTSLLVAAPGSRSTALALAAAAHPGVELTVALDERSAAFHALGFAKQSGAPTAVLTTSGTAVANLVPAVVEADLSGAPLVVVSADRPPEMRKVGANQAIEQAGLFGGLVRMMVDMGLAEVHPSAPRFWRSSVAQVVGAAQGFGGRPGPVHLNLSFREPTVPVSDDGRSRDDPYPYAGEGRTEDRPWTSSLVGRHPSPEVVSHLREMVDRSRRGLIVVGAGSQSVVELGRRLGWPVLATAESGLRGHPDVIGTGHHLVGRMEPDLLVRFGSHGPSRRLLDLVSADVPQVVIGGGWSDPARSAMQMVDADPEAVAGALADSVPVRHPDGWGKWWEEADAAVQTALRSELEERISEPAVAAVVGSSGADRLSVASSMPIRDMEAYAFSSPPLIANRGASGIDGFVSLALGASRGAQKPLALTGDLSLHHDANGFLVEPRPGCVFVVVDNSGGGIFSFLPQAEHVGEHFERLFGTPPGRDIAHLAELHGLGMREVDDLSALHDAVREGWQEGGCHLVVVRTDRQENVAEHARLNRLAADAVAAVPLPGDQ